MWSPFQWREEGESEWEKGVKKCGVYPEWRAEGESEWEKGLMGCGVHPSGGSKWRKSGKRD